MIGRVITAILFCGVLIWLTIDSAEGFTEIKEYHVINSPAVCGDKMCSDSDEGRAKKVLSSHDIKICGIDSCPESGIEKANSTDQSNPIRQFHLGIPLDQIYCKNGQALIIKATNHYPACVNFENMEKFMEKGWAISEQKQLELFEAIPKQRVMTESLDTSSGFAALMNIVLEEINNKRYLIFEGDGWHRLHNVEITILGEAFEESIRTKTDERGHLYMPWPIPERLNTDTYRITATDKIHDFEITMPIMAPKTTTISSGAETILKLYKHPSTTFDGGQPIVFVGKLSTLNGDAVHKAKIFIKNDTDCPEDNIVGEGFTDRDGRFWILVISKIWNEDNNIVTFHAEFKGDVKYSSSVSENQAYVVYPSVAEKCTN